MAEVAVEMPSRGPFSQAVQLRGKGRVVRVVQHWRRKRLRPGRHAGLDYDSKQQADGNENQLSICASVA